MLLINVFVSLSKIWTFSSFPWHKVYPLTILGFPDFGLPYLYKKNNFTWIQQSGLWRTPFKCKLVFLTRKFIKNSDLATETQIFPLKIPNFRKFLEIKLSILIAYRHSKQSSVNQNHKNKERYWLVTTIETFKIRTISWPLSWKISTCCSGNTCDDFIIIEVRKKQHQ